MSSTEKTPPCPQNSQDPLHPPRQHDRSSCPTWCDGEHLEHEPDPLDSGFHHRAALLHLDLPDGVGRDDGYVQVVVSRYQPDPDDPEDYPPFVEVHASDNAGCLDLALLTAEEAVDVATALLEAASRVRDL